MIPDLASVFKLRQGIQDRAMERFYNVFEETESIAMVIDQVAGALSQALSSSVQ